MRETLKTGSKNNYNGLNFRGDANYQKQRIFSCN